MVRPKRFRLLPPQFMFILVKRVVRFMEKHYGNVACLLLLAVLSGNAMADWVRVASVPSADEVIYADPDTIYRDGNRVSMWNLIDFTLVQRSPGSTEFPEISFLSAKAKHEYDCTTGQMRILSYTWYSDNMGKGDAVYGDDTAGGWNKVIPDSPQEILMHYACEKKQGTG